MRRKKTIGMVIEKHNLIAVSYKEQLSKERKKVDMELIPRYWVMHLEKKNYNETI